MLTRFSRCASHIVYNHYLIVIIILVQIHREISRQMLWSWDNSFEVVIVVGLREAGMHYCYHLPFQIQRENSADRYATMVKFFGDSLCKRREECSCSPIGRAVCTLHSVSGNMRAIWSSSRYIRTTWHSRWRMRHLMRSRRHWESDKLIGNASKLAKHFLLTCELTETSIKSYTLTYSWSWWPCDTHVTLGSSQVPHVHFCNF